MPPASQERKKIGLYRGKDIILFDNVGGETLRIVGDVPDGGLMMVSSSFIAVGDTGNMRV